MIKRLSRQQITSLRSLSQSDLQTLLGVCGPAEAELIRGALGNPDQTAYRRDLDYDTEYHRKRSAIGRDIGSIPACADPARRCAASKSLRVHLETYRAHVFTCPWASYHYRLIDLCEEAVEAGGWFAMAVPRGGGKTMICEGLVEWCVLHGKKHWPVLIGATGPLGEAMLGNLKTEFSSNKLLLADFPELLFALSALENDARRCKGQLCCGARTDTEWSPDRIVFPTITPGEYERWAIESFDSQDFERPLKNFGARIMSFGITGSFRGLSERTAELNPIRPDMAVADDPQTRESSKSFTQSQDRAATIKGDVAYLAGPTSKMTVVLPCTVINRGDMADTMLDRELSPEWHGERHKMLESLPHRMDLWDEYAEIVRQCWANDWPVTKANDFYAENREAMDAGARVSWEHRYPNTCLSAIQHAMNLRIRDYESFCAEAQNDPQSGTTTETVKAEPIQIIASQHHCGRGVVPHFADKIVAHIDVQQRLLFAAVAAGSEDFEAAFIDYYTLPDQQRNYFSYQESLNTIQDVFTESSNLDVQLYKAIQVAIDQLANRVFVREDGVEMKINRILVDSGYKSSVVVRACRESPHRALVMPMKGFGVRAKDTPFALRKAKSGEKKGHEWFVKPKPDVKSILYVQANVNAWKTTLHAGFLSAGGPGNVTLWHDRPERHRMFAEHCCNEDVTRVKAGENEVDEWNERPGSPDNHHFDNAVGCMVALSMEGCALKGVHDTENEKPRRKSKVITRQQLIRRSSA